MEPVEVLWQLPESGVAGKLVFLTSDNSLYRFDGHAYVKAQSGTDLSEARIKVDPEPFIPPELSRHPDFYHFEALF